MRVFCRTTCRCLAELHVGGCLVCRTTCGCLAELQLGGCLAELHACVLQNYMQVSCRTTVGRVSCRTTCGCLAELHAGGCLAERTTVGRMSCRTTCGRMSCRKNYMRAGVLQNYSLASVLQKELQADGCLAELHAGVLHNHMQADVLQKELESGGCLAELHAGGGGVAGPGVSRVLLRARAGDPRLPDRQRERAARLQGAPQVQELQVVHADRRRRGARQVSRAVAERRLGGGGCHAASRSPTDKYGAIPPRGVTGLNSQDFHPLPRRASWMIIAQGSPGLII